MAEKHVVDMQVTLEERDARRALDEALRRRMEPVQGTRRPGDELDVQAASGPDAVERERRGE